MNIFIFFIELMDNFNVIKTECLSSTEYVYFSKRIRVFANKK